ncbi:MULTISPECIES: AbrB/MazE/SpoVT family DNA-binding domain-containing protein [Enterococcus]|uniref:addiction module antitoxin n=1 Tax=Enterococcus TaxID=1350 RepID=UPI00065DF0A8|nr:MULTISPECIES: addiction module antitoxin [Enterococcus]KAF1302530.1 addiction module antitoxin [Enterococcus sp. JM9B]
MKNETKKYKVRKSGNSDVTTVPPEVKNWLQVNTGGSISYIFESDGSVRMVKAAEEVNVDAIVDSVMEQYNQAIKDLVDL